VLELRPPVLELRPPVLELRPPVLESKLRGAVPLVLAG